MAGKGKIYLNGVDYSGSIFEPNPEIPAGAVVTPVTNMKVDDDYYNLIGSGGTSVEGNPTVPSGVTPTALTGLKIDNDYYSISGGSGSSSDDYTTTEQVVGTWIDGRPLYQKTYHDTNTWISANVEILDSNFTPDVYDNFFVTDMHFMVNSTYMNGSGNVGSAGMEVSCSQTSGLGVSCVESVTVDNFDITIRYTKVSDL